MIDMKINKIKTRNTITTSYQNNSASSFWLGSEFEIHYDAGNRFDLTKLAAAQRAIGNFVSIVTGKQIPVIFKGQESYTDGKSVVIGTKIEGKNFDPAVGLALHEGSHIALTNFNIVENLYRAISLRGGNPDLNISYEDESLIHNLLNWIEDRRIDLASYKAAPGYRKYYESMYDTYFNAKVIDKALISGEKVSEDWDCYLFHIINFTNPNRDLDALEKLRDVWNLINLSNIQRLKSTSDALTLAVEVYLMLKQHIKEQEASQSKANSQSSDNQCDNPNCSGESDSGDKADGEDSQDGGEDRHDAAGQNTSNQQQGSEGSRKSSLSKADQRRLEKQIEQQKDFLRGEIDPGGRKVTKKDGKLLRAIRESGTEVVSVQDQDRMVDTIVIRKLTKNVIDQFDRFFVGGTNTRDQRQRVVNQGIILGKQLGRKLQVRNEDRSLKSTRLPNGKIDRRLISQLGAGAENVFHRIVTDQYKNYFLHISIDASGSMGGTKFNNAIKSAVAVAQAASMTRGIRVQISFRGTGSVGGDNTDRSVTVYAYDSATDSMTKIKSLFKYIGTFGCTPEGLAFKSIEKYLLQDAKQEECIFLNYSDGMPSGYVNQPVEFTANVIKRFREHGMKIISFFISDQYDDQYWRERTMQKFRKMYGTDAEYIDPTRVIDISKALNKKFLEQKQLS
jgi:hypothetical protein